jgi:hypothetical protein
MGEDSGRIDPKKPSWMDAPATSLEHAEHPLPKEEACNEEAKDPCKDSKDSIEGVFDFMQGYAHAELDKLGADLKKIDKPDWQTRLLEEFFDIALVTGGALTGEYLVEHIGKDLAKNAKGAAELIKKSLEEGAPDGAKTALESLGGSEDPDIDQFVLVQKLGLSAMYQTAKSNFIKIGRHQLRSTQEAAALDASFTPTHLIAAAQKQYFASLDAYLSCLAKQTLGATTQGTTNMAPQSERDESSDGHAPDQAGAMIGMDKGVLVADVLVHDDVTREPGVWSSYLNGVNDTVRAKYQNVPLSMLKLPRQLVCSVRGDMSDFTVNVDEAGTMYLAKGTGEWLEARARALRPDVAQAARPEQQRIGLDRLLGDLKIDKIGHGG